MADTPVRPVLARKESVAKKLLAYLKLTSDVASIVMDLRDSPKGLDWAGVAMRSLNVGIGWYADRRKVGKIPPLWEYFNGDESGWTVFPKEYKNIVVANAQELVVADEYLEGDVKFPFAVKGRIGKEVVGWAVEAGQVIDGPFYRTDREDETLVSLGEMLWRALGGKHLLYAPDGLVVDTMSPHKIIPTVQMDDLLERVRKFMKAKVPRGYLLHGAPGTGKSLTIQWLIKVLGMTSVRIDLGLLGDESERRGSSVTASLETMFKVLRPEVMILDDIDRIEVNASVLAILERAQYTCRIVVASANSLSALSGAALRPGRFDDIIEFAKLDPNVIDHILGEFKSLAPKVADLPAAYVEEFARRCRVLGKKQALLDLPDLVKRAAQTALDSDE